MINWLNSSVEQRKKLYSVLKLASDERNQTIGKIYKDIFNENMGSRYDATLRNGEYSRKRAQQIYLWLEQKYPQLLAKTLNIDLKDSSYFEHKEQNDDKQPQLELRLVDDKEDTRFIYRSRTIPYIEPKKAFEQLDAFCNASQLFCWHVLTGAGGTGKSRLALEYAISLEKTGVWDVGFLVSQSVRDIDWTIWQPTKPIFMIIDYAARETDLVGHILRALSSREDLKRNVRIVLLERELGGSWFHKIIQSGITAGQFIEECWFGEDGTLEAPDDVWPVIRFMCQNNMAYLPTKEKALQELERIDPFCRPLFAAFLGDAYSRGDNPRYWDAYELVHNVLTHEMHHWKNGGVDQSHINLCACATSTAGIQGVFIEVLSQDMQGFWPDWRGSETFEKLIAIYGLGLVDDIPPLEPDILGEVFYLQQWQQASRFERQKFLAHGINFAPWFAEFLERLILDFPNENHQDLLKNFLSSDLHHYENTQPELIYNLITGLTKKYPSHAVALFEYFKFLDLNELTDYGAECFIDGVLNLIVGIEDFPIDKALSIYDFVNNTIPKSKTSNSVAKSLASLSLTLIAQYPSENSETFRHVLARSLRLYRQHQNDDNIRRDCCIAISNYINTLDGDELDHALILLKIFCNISRQEHDGDMAITWEYIFYHVFLLHLIQREEDEISQHNITLSMAEVASIAPEFEKYRAKIQLRLDMDMDEQ